MVAIRELGRRGSAGHERVIGVEDSASGLRAVIAIHSTGRGPAFGGCRMMRYAAPRVAVRDALRLSEAMSRKAAMAGLPYGGGKCVVLADPATQKTDALLLALGQALNMLGGRYLTADDVGTSVGDMEVMRRVTPHARGLPQADGAACPAAAHGVLMALRAAVTHAYGRLDLRGLHVAVQGLGHLGMRLCEELHAEGARLTVADLSPARTSAAAAAFGAAVVAPEEILGVKADVLSPNALGDVICDATLPAIRAGVVVGGANNQLRSPRHGVGLHRRGILYVPDYVANAGGLIDVAMEGPGYRVDRVLAACESIHDRTARLLHRAAREGVPVSVMADRMSAAAMERDAAVREVA